MVVDSEPVQSLTGIAELFVQEYLGLTTSHLHTQLDPFASEKNTKQFYA